MKRKWNLAALLPGFLTLNSGSAIATQNATYEERNPFDELMIAPLNLTTPEYIAGHRSHSSHSSHGSHRSSSGSSSRSYSAPKPAPRTPSYKSDPLGQPSTPTYTAPQKGNDKKQFDRTTLIMRVQISLRMLGYYNGQADGIMGPVTRNAISRYRLDKGLPSSEKIDAVLLNSLGISAP